MNIVIQHDKKIFVVNDVEVYVVFYSFEGYISMNSMQELTNLFKRSFMAVRAIY